VNLLLDRFAVHSLQPESGRILRMFAEETKQMGLRAVRSDSPPHGNSWTRPPNPECEVHSPPPGTAQVMGGNIVRLLEKKL